MLVRVIIAVIVFACLLAIFRRARARRGSTDRPRAVEAKTARCAVCDVYFPRDEGVTLNGRAYCSHAHARKGGD